MDASDTLLVILMPMICTSNTDANDTYIASNMDANDTLLVIWMPMIHC